MTVFWVIWDGAAEPLVQRFADAGELPVLSSLRQNGVHAGLPATEPNCQTPAGLATLLTGTDPAEHGVTGFWVPGGPDGLKGQRRGFDPDVLRCRPVWSADSGLRAAFLHAPWVFGADGSVPAAAAVAVDAFNRRVSREDSRKLAPGQDVTWRCDRGALRLRRDLDGGYAAGPDGKPLTSLGDGWTLIGGERDARWIRVVGGHVVSAARFDQRVAGFDRRLTDRMRDALAAAGPFAGESLGSLYRQGVLGTPCTAGGDGTAESQLLDGVELASRPFTAAVRTLATDPALRGLELVVAYFPMSDDVGHELLASAVVERFGWEPAADALRATYRRLDTLLGQLLEGAEASDIVVVCADHGMTPVRFTCYVNNVLAKAGLAVPAVCPDDGADVGASPVWYHLSNNGLLLANHRSLPGGFLDDDSAARALRDGMAVLRELRTGSGRTVVTGFADERGRPVPAKGGGWTAYVLFADGCMPWPDCTPDGRVLGPPLRGGAHHTNNSDPWLAATFTAGRVSGDLAEEPVTPRMPSRLSEVGPFVMRCVNRQRRQERLS